MSFFFCNSLFAATDACWKNEINPTTQKTYSSQAEYQNDLAKWNKQSNWVNPIQLARAYQVYVQEKAHSLTLESDKMSHCYIGCRIRQKTDFKTVRYVAWLKEKQDLTDCDPNSHFEIQDFNATILGGVYLVTTAEQCLSTCRQELPRLQ